MVDNEYKRLKDQLVEQKISKQVTITAGSTTTTAIDIPATKKVFLKGYGYSWYTLNKFNLSTGNRAFPEREDQEGSTSIPMIFGNPFPVRSGGQLKLTIYNGDATDHTYDIVFYILTNDHLDETSTGGELILATGSGSGSTGGNVAIYDSTFATVAGVTADGLEVHVDKALPSGTNNIGDVDVLTAPVPISPTTLLSGTLTTGGATAEALGASTSCKKITIQIDSTSDDVLIGNASSQDITLVATQSIDIEIDDLAKIYIKRSGANNVIVNYIGS